MQTDVHARLQTLEQELVRSRRWGRGLAALVVVSALVGPQLSQAGRTPASLSVASSDGTRSAEITPDGFVFTSNGKTRAKLTIGASYNDFTLYEADGSTTVNLGTDEHGSSLKLFSSEERLRAEFSEKLIDSGSGVRLYDANGFPRATLYSDRRNGETGLELTDANRQPRVDIFAQPDGVTVFRANTSGAEAAAELSILPESDVKARQTGGVPETRDGEPFVPMVYLLGRSGDTKLVTP